MKIRQTVLLFAAAIALGSSSLAQGAKCSPKTSAPATTSPAAEDVPQVTTATPTAVVDDDEVGAEDDDYSSTVSSSAWDNTDESTASSSTWDSTSSYTSTASSAASSTASSSTWDASSSYTSTASSAASSTASSSDVESEASAASSAASSGASTSNSTSTSTTTTADHATFGTVTSASGECVIGEPAEYITKSDVDWIWEQRMSKYVPDFNNYIFDQLHTNKGSLEYCIRWDSTDKLSLSVASKFEAMLNRQFKAWNQWLIGYDCWPYEEITVKVVGIAVRDASLLDWTDDSLGKIYEGELDSDGIPQCPQACYKHRDFAASADTSSCTGTPFDMSLWPTLGMGGGAGGDWGQRVDAASMLASIDDEQLVIVAHEIGHGFGLPDFYEESEAPNGLAALPACIMQAGRSMSITPGDGWMLRSVYEHISSRY